MTLLNEIKLLTEGPVVTLGPGCVGEISRLPLDGEQEVFVLFNSGVSRI